MRTALTIAGSDPSGGAGIQADLKTFAAFGVFGLSAITAVTAQDTRGVTAVAPLPAGLVTAQIEAVAEDLEIHATKIGMLATAEVVHAVAAAINDFDLPMVVLDPVLAASGGQRLLDAAGVQALCSELLPCARVITPNIPEAEALSGCRIATISDRRRAAERIGAMGVSAVIITGGHEPGPEVMDLLYDGSAFFELRAPRVGGRRAHGTGCTFASALAAGLALRQALPEAAARAQQYVAGAIAHATAVGKGASVLDHFWRTKSG
ncbi:MAG: bifunctional hydroxymethylpyrimidine kinase/phosphomethylpyrimidine kinase [Acidobacteria bacterium RIFCSPLOWO2_12_FULL_65_11]|nr:MAG: bifunctional hydroxymethylpyrimidine kinase/phosphomethylpyrimidine kinase [Acidobacteria bacterium RIFCSPLOWO2_02_FULL_64_15]OFW32140.1 MAG: bifunctional hydroxymethylpyrimidine kinase/phosphomethylpyrimidine kinase [Acidobacteria bacterium RIFCSPLOWO2_12_FULL_65_11]